jgi:glycosyltransferase involved in cell wall biosynthesis
LGYNINVKILVATGTFYPDVGGPSRYLFNLSHDLSLSGHKIAVITYGEGRGNCAYPFEVTYVSRNLPLPVRFAMFFKEVLSRGRYFDLLFVNDYGLPPVLANKILKKPLVMKIVGDFAWELSVRRGWTTDGVDEFQKKSYPLKVEIIRHIQDFYARNADAVITPGTYLKKLVKGWGVEEDRIRVIRNAVSRDKYCIPESKEAARKVIGIGEGIILTVARLTRWKGIDKLIEILPYVDPEYKLVVVGSGPEMQRLLNLSSSLGVSERVVFAGNVPPDKVACYLAACDVLVLYSGYEGLSHVLLEAMMVGIPVITTEKGGNPELIKDGFNGLLVTYGDKERLCSVLKHLLEDESLRRKLSENCRTAVKDFDWNNLLGETLALFREVISSKGRH